MNFLNSFKHFSWFAWIMDMVILFLFIWIGLQQHEIVTTYWYPLLAVLPFWLSWTIIGLATRSFDLDPETGSRTRTVKLMFSWTVALVLALAFRYLLFDKPPVFTFAIVSFIFNGSLFWLWRTIFIRWYNGAVSVKDVSN